MKNRNRVNAITAVVLFFIILFIAGCTSADFDYQFEQTNADLEPARIRIKYCSIGGKEYNGFEGTGPNGWKIKVDKSVQQEIDVETLAALIAEALIVKP